MIVKFLMEVNTNTALMQDTTGKTMVSFSLFCFHIISLLSDLCKENIQNTLLSVYFITLYIFPSVDFNSNPYVLSFFSYTKLYSFIPLYSYFIHTDVYNILPLKTWWMWKKNVYVFCLLTVFSDSWSDKKRNVKTSNILTKSNEFLIWKSMQISAYLSYKNVYCKFEWMLFESS